MPPTLLSIDMSLSLRMIRRLLGGGRSVVQSFESQAAAHASITDDGDHMAVFLAFFGSGNSHAKGGGELNLTHVRR